MTDQSVGKKTRCSACLHAERSAIDDLLIKMTPEREVGKRFGLTSASLHRHKAHIHKLAVEGKGADALEPMRLRLRDIAHRAREQKRVGDELAAMKELRALEELEIRLEVEKGSTQLLTSSPAWQAFARKLLDSLAGCPSCTKSVVKSMPGGRPVGRGEYPVTGMIPPGGGDSSSPAVHFQNDGHQKDGALRLDGLGSLDGETEDTGDDEDVDAAADGEGDEDADEVGEDDGEDDE